MAITRINSVNVIAIAEGHRDDAAVSPNTAMHAA
jgi:hypothetical protein